MHLGFAHLDSVVRGQSAFDTRRDNSDVCLHEGSEMREDMLKNAVGLMDLEGNEGSAELGEEMEVGAVDITWPKRTVGSHLSRRVCSCLLYINGVEAQKASLRRI